MKTKRTRTFIRRIAAAGIIAALCANTHASIFRPGETYRYKITWLGLPLAWAESSVDEIEHEGRKLIRIKMVAQSYAAYNTIYPVDDVTEVWADPETGLPVRVDVVTNEGDRNKSHFTTFYREQGVAIFQDRITKDIKEIPIKEDTLDVFTFIMKHRATNLDILGANTYQVYADGKLYDMELVIMDEDKVDLSEYGKVKSTEIEPHADFDGIFVRDGKVRFWISKQEPRVLTMMKASVPVGSVTIKLEKASGTGEPFWDKEKQ